jgi:hypothetical protein
MEAYRFFQVCISGVADSTNRDIFTTILSVAYFCKAHIQLPHLILQPLVPVTYQFRLRKSVMVLETKYRQI